MEATTLLYLLVGILSATYLLDLVLDLLNLGRMRPEIPEILQGHFSEEEYQKSIAYQRERSHFGLLMGALSFVGTLVILLSGFLGWWDGVLRGVTEDPLALTFLYLGTLFGASTILGLPASLYSTFVIEEKHGFNKTTPRLFLLDTLKGLLLSAVLGGGLLWVFLWLLRELGPDFWLWFLGVYLVLVLVMQFFLIGPFLRWFNKLTPLEDGELRQSLKNFADKVNFPLQKILVIDGSKRSAKSNAFFTGFGRARKVVLYDTLIEQASNDELVAILAHEIGHYKKRHIPLSMGIGFLTVAGTLFLLSKIIFTPELSFALGGEIPAIHLNLIAFALLFSPLSDVLDLMGNLISRKNEYEADRYAREHFSAEPMRSALIKLSSKNKSFLTPHPAYVFFNYSHPTLLQRLRALGAE